MVNWWSILVLVNLTLIWNPNPSPKLGQNEESFTFKFGDRDRDPFNKYHWPVNKLSMWYLHPSCWYSGRSGGAEAANTKCLQVGGRGDGPVWGNWGGDSLKEKEQKLGLGLSRQWLR
ncbi:hypothetical protein AVEN_105908-1 [Araneus ventricosus]|uniref:Uncharacterized protein n=1 Tax=Araneus ventricosus TaxID=182803 RepID=A0A4Y2T163_ARAVE|nr:hypothetical protein AVEN_105908-1 [Araneus ventricosus]